MADQPLLDLVHLRRALEDHVRSAAVRMAAVDKSHTHKSSMVRRSRSTPPPTTHRATVRPDYNNRPLIYVPDPLSKEMLVTQAIDLTFDDVPDDWVTPAKTRLYRTASVGNSWGVTSIGRGFNWSAKQKGDEIEERKEEEPVPSGSFIEPSLLAPPPPPSLTRQFANRLKVHTQNGASSSTSTSGTSSFFDEDSQKSSGLSTEPISDSPISRSPFSSSAVSLTSLVSSNGHPPRRNSTLSGSTESSSNTRPRPRRRSSQQRVSLVAGRLSMVAIEPPSPPPITSPKLLRYGSQSSLLSATSTAPPTSSEKETFLGGRSISEFVIEGELGRGAYGLVKKAREMKNNGEVGDPVIIKQIIKSRILADCWKRHPKFGTIPIEIYVMSSISSSSYILPPKRPWDPSRMYERPEDDPDPWIEGKVVKGHPNICPLLDFFEDINYYYLVLPSMIPPPNPDGSAASNDLFDLVESYPQGLPPPFVRSYLGQIADALCFLHAKGIVHRDIKDENVILGKRPGSCILIDFGSSGIVKKNGWDTFSGTLDYAGPEILRGERYHGKEQDVWAFGVVAFVLLVGECPFNTAAEAQEGLVSPFANASIALDERCGEGKEKDGEEKDGGGCLGDAAALVRACLNVDLTLRPTFESILESKFLNGGNGWGFESGSHATTSS